MTQEQKDKETAAYDLWVSTQKSAKTLKDQYDAIQTLLDNDPLKYSDRDLTLNGVTKIRGNWQTDADNLSKGYATQNAQANVYKAAYDRLVLQDNTQDAAAQQAANTAYASSPVAAEIQKAKIAADAKLATVQGTTKYLIWGTIGLVIVIAAIIGVRHYLKNK